MNPRLFQHIATRLNRDTHRQNGITAQQVASIASGEDRTESHPVWQLIAMELRKKGFKL